VENVDVEYFNTQKEINSTYLIDLDIQYKDGSRRLVEVKPECWLTDENVLAKIAAGKKRAEELGTTYEVWTEMDLFGHVYNERNMRLFVEKIKSGEI
jgi:hypothetical protein